MIDILQGSFLWRLICGFWLSFQHSLIYTLGCRLCASWHNSRTVGRIVRISKTAPSLTQGSGLKGRLQQLNQVLWQFGQRVLPALENSLLYRLYGAIYSWGRNSFLLGWLFRGGLTSFLLVAVGSYCAIDYVLRDLLAVPVLSSTWDEALLLLAVLWTLYDLMRQKKPLETRLNPLDTPVFLFITVGFGLMFLVSPFFSIAVSGYRATVQYMVWFFLITRLIRDDKDFLTLYLALLAVAFLISLHGIYQYIIAAPMPGNWIDQAESSVRTRVYSIFGSPNIMGDFMVMFAPLAAGMAYFVKDKKGKIFFWLVTISMCLACLFTMSRGAWAAMALAIVIFALLVDKRLFVLMLVAAVLSMFLPFVASRIGYLLTEEYAASTANGGRNSRWDIALSYLSTSPVFGVGLGMFGGAIAMQHKIYIWVSYFYVDNYYLKILTEMGYVGFGAFLVMMISAVSTGFRAVFRTSKQKINPLCAGMISGLCGVLLHCYSENIFEEPYMMVYFWSILAMLVYAGFLRKPQNLEKECESNV